VKEEEEEGADTKRLLASSESSLAEVGEEQPETFLGEEELEALSAAVEEEESKARSAEVRAEDPPAERESEPTWASEVVAEATSAMVAGRGRAARAHRHATRSMANQ
jgi:hypothetical protein